MINPADLVATNAEAGASTLTVEATGGPVALSVAPALDVAEPITLARAKDHLRVVVADEDAYISGLITAARQMAEGRLNRTIVQRRRVATFESWTSDIARWSNRPAWRTLPRSMHLLKPPILSVDNVGYLDASGAEVMLDASAYYMPPVNDDEMPRVEVRADAALPVLSYGRRDALRVYYTAGYPVGEVPAPIIQWMLLAIGTMYDNRESVVTGTTSVSLADNFAKWLLQPYEVYE